MRNNDIAHLMFTMQMRYTVPMRGLVACHARIRQKAHEREE